MRIGALGASSDIARALRGNGHEVLVLDALPSRGIALSLDLLIVAGHAGKIGVDVYAAPRLGSWNVHPSLLPAHRGPQPLRWSILRGDERFGVTIHQMTDVIDHGPIWWRSALTASPEPHERWLARLVALAASATPELVRKAVAGVAPAAPGPIAPMEPRVPPALLRLDPRLPARDFLRRVAAGTTHTRVLRGARDDVTLLEATTCGPSAGDEGRVLAVDHRSVTLRVRDALVMGRTAVRPRTRAGELLRAPIPQGGPR